MCSRCRGLNQCAFFVSLCDLLCSAVCRWTAVREEACDSWALWFSRLEEAAGAECPAPPGDAAPRPGAPHAPHLGRETWRMEATVQVGLLGTLVAMVYPLYWSIAKDWCKLLTLLVHLILLVQTYSLNVLLNHTSYSKHFWFLIVSKLMIFWVCISHCKFFMPMPF